jgi:hypothetical protein
MNSSQMDKAKKQIEKIKELKDDYWELFEDYHLLEEKYDKLKWSHLKELRKKDLKFSENHLKEENEDLRQKLFTIDALVKTMKKSVDDDNKFMKKITKENKKLKEEKKHYQECYVAQQRETDIEHVRFLDEQVKRGEIQEDIQKIINGVKSGSEEELRINKILHPEMFDDEEEESDTEVLRLEIQNTKNTEDDPKVLCVNYGPTMKIFKIPKGLDLKDEEVVDAWGVKYGEFHIDYKDGRTYICDSEINVESDYKYGDETIEDAEIYNVEYDSNDVDSLGVFEDPDMFENSEEEEEEDISGFKKHGLN